MLKQSLGDGEHPPIARKRADWFGQNFRPFDWRDRASDRPKRIDLQGNR
jgi:hypothetical protein